MESENNRPTKSYHPLCPHCGAMLIDQGDIPTYQAERTDYGKYNVWMLWCGFCHKVISAFPLPREKRT